MSEPQMLMLMLMRLGLETRRTMQVVDFEINNITPGIHRNLEMRLAGHVARMGETRNAYRILVGKPEGKIPL
jgi:hypothetical protein